MECPCKFEPTVQTSCVLEIISAVRKGQLLVQRYELISHAACVAGSLAAYQLQTPQALSAPVAYDLPETLEEAANEVNLSLAIMQERATKDQVAGLSPAFVALLERLIKLLLSQIL